MPKNAALPSTPNAKTVEAMRAARRGELKSAASAEHLIASLRADN